MDGRRWGFAALSDEEFDQFTRTAPTASTASPVAPPSPRGADDPVVDVTVGPAGEVEAVSLADRWRDAVDPAELGREVVGAVGRGIARALADASTAPPAPAAASEPVDLGPWGGSFRRLLEEARRDAERYASAAAALRRQDTSATSAARHITGTARHGVVTEVGVDPAWARAAPAREIEGELLEVLAELGRRAVPASMRGGPAHPAAEALGCLAADPAALARAAGMVT